MHGPRVISGRPTPFSLVFGELAPARFPSLGAVLARAGVDPGDRDAFLLVREVAELVKELRPDDGLGEGVGALASLVHAAFVFWRDGERLVTVGEPELGALLGRLPGISDATAAPAAAYVQLPPLRIWGVPFEGANPEPLDGWFRTGSPEGLNVVAAFGLHPGRAGLTVVEVRGPPPRRLVRPDGSALFSPTLAGAAAAGLASLAGEAELLELAWRVEGIP